ncbi:hypothetical protein DASC09_021890 [Saccharomycopsis crataegensis]|uniref:Uncharacterized protein n=1 Tax=Saccharomycopsis crataegensis TaxID=43959 RepID=A0AAV5QJS1_9ASCO|nr:hypothetical protein DASC09_021890 [Saccharomycopsis crataegensis]
MTARRSLYGQSLIRNASNISFGTPTAEPIEHYFQPTLINPSKPADEEEDKNALANGHSIHGSNVSLSSMNGKPETINNSPKYSFKVLSWVPHSKPYSVSDCDEDDILDIKQIITDKEAEDTAIDAALANKNDSNALSAADIRGAVGVEEGISGLSASTDNATRAKEQQNNTEESTAPTEVSSASEPIVQDEVSNNPAGSEVDGTEKKEPELQESEVKKVEEPTKDIQPGDVQINT